MPVAPTGHRRVAGGWLGASSAGVCPRLWAMVAGQRRQSWNFGTVCPAMVPEITASHKGLRVLKIIAGVKGLASRGEALDYLLTRSRTPSSRPATS